MEELIRRLFAEVQQVLPPNRRATSVLLESKDLNFYPDQTRVEVRMEYANGIEYPNAHTARPGIQKLRALALSLILMLMVHARLFVNVSRMLSL